MSQAIRHEIDCFLRTGAHDLLCPAWPGGSVVETMRCASSSLRQALICQVLDRSRLASEPVGLEGTDLIAMTRARVSPVVRGLFPTIEQSVVLDVLARSIIFLTPLKIEGVLRSEPYLRTAWNLANLYLLSCDAEPLAANAPEIIGLSQDTTCYVSMRYFSGGGRFDDIVVHEAAHIFHNCKRKRVGLKGTRRREWLLEIDYAKRETFAYACEALSRITELGDSASARRALLADLESGPPPADDRVDASEYIDILREAVGARNGWKCILRRCAPDWELLERRAPK